MESPSLADPAADQEPREPPVAGAFQPSPTPARPVAPEGGQAAPDVPPDGGTVLDDEPAEPAMPGTPSGNTESPADGQGPAEPDEGAVAALRHCDEWLDGAEQEPNDNQSAALGLPCLRAGDVIHGELTEQDQDWFSFELTTPSHVWLWTDVPGAGCGTDTVLDLYDEAGMLVAGGSDEDEGSSVCEQLSPWLPAGVYVVRVYHIEADWGPYTLQLEVPHGDERALAPLPSPQGADLVLSREAWQHVPGEWYTLESELTSLQPCTISDIQVTVDIAHPEPRELVLGLRAPDGTEVALRRVWTDAPASGTYPTSLTAAEPLSALQGLSALGTWALRVTDEGLGGVGMLRRWQLAVTCDAPCAPAPTPSFPVRVNLLGEGDDTQPPCAGAPGGEDVEFTFVAPQDGDYLFHTGGSTFDTVLHARSPSCGAPALACNDDTAQQSPITLSQIELPLSAGQAVVLVVEAHSAQSQSGIAQLNVGQGNGAGSCEVDADCNGDCPQEVLSPAAFPLERSTAFAANRFEPRTCQYDPQGAPDYAFIFEADRSGQHTLRARGQTNLILYALDDCGGSELDCDDEDEGGDPELTFELEAAERILVVVDGFEPGDFGDFWLGYDFTESSEQAPDYAPPTGPSRSCDAAYASSLMAQDFVAWPALCAACTSSAPVHRSGGVHLDRDGATCPAGYRCAAPGQGQQGICLVGDGRLECPPTHIARGGVCWPALSHLVPLGGGEQWCTVAVPTEVSQLTDYCAALQ